MKNSLFFRLLNSILTSILLFCKSYKEVLKSDIILTVTNPPLNVILISLLSIIKKNKTILLVHDVFPDNLVSIGVLKKHGILFRFFSMIFNYFLSKYDTIITIGDDMKNLIEDKVSKSKSNVILIPNWCDNVKNNNTNKIINTLNFTYAGNIGRVQNLEVLVNLFKLANNVKIQLSILGDGQNRDKLKSILKNCSSENIFLGPPFRRSEQSKVLKNCNISIISLKKGMKGLAFPSKFYSYLSLGKPILFLGDKSMDIANEIKSNNIGWVFDYDNSDEIIEFFTSADKISNSDIQKKTQNCILLSKKYSKETVLNMFDIDSMYNFKKNL